MAESEVHPASVFLREMTGSYPKAARQADMFRNDPPMAWPAWCFLPRTAVTAIVTNGRDLDQASQTYAEVGMGILLHTALCWRPGQDIARFDPELYQALVETPLSDEIPEELLYRLPSWCMYVELQNEEFHGFFVHLEFDPVEVRSELRLLFLPHGTGLPMPIIMHLGHNSIQAGIASFLAESRRRANESRTFTQILNRIESSPDYSLHNEKVDRLIRLALSLTLYLCSAEPEYGPQADGSRQPGMPSPKKVKGGWRIFPQDRPKIWEIGKETGIKIRAARAGQGGGSGTRRPHIRRAHWHTYWTGKKKFAEGETPVPQTPQAKWLPPIAVAMQEDMNDD